MPSLNEITVAQLMRLFGGPSTPVLLDVRIDEDADAMPFIIPGSIRIAHNDVLDLLPKIKGRKVVVICHKGKKLSLGASAILRSVGVESESLTGGVVDWKAAGYPMTPRSALTGKPGEPTLWVTRHRPKIDRIATPWLIRRFIDRDARFLYVPPAEVLDVADRFSATAFDTPGAPFSHVDGKCTFDAIIGAFNLSHEPLDRLAELVRAADTNQLDASPQAAGLMAMSVGLSRLYKDDQDQLNAALPLYDALYRWARDGFDEVHDHQEAR
ncbi:chromate resistance protein ChrB domain-containing protein [Shimia sp.]|uniref:chromate resistance protein ChrB domain-containing protein n=1 Tax=Shimia sp. TaxID=1954381 RepID=UPI003296D021